MTIQPQIIHIDDVEPERMDEGKGWFITDFRLPLSDRQGLGSTMFRARFFPGAVHKKHRHEACDEIYYIISGDGVAGAAGSVEDVSAGDFHYVPKNIEHWLANQSAENPIEVIGWYVGAGSVAATQYVFMGDVTEDDIHSDRIAYAVGALVHTDKVVPEQSGDGANIGISDIRLTIGHAQSSPNAAWQTIFAPGESNRKHLHESADEFYFVLEGEAQVGIGDLEAELRPGHAVFIPKNTPHWVKNTSADKPFIAVGIYEGADSFAASGTVFLD